MPQTPHAERHFSGSEVVRDIVTGMSDGLTVPFALAAGLSGIANSTAIVITGGLAEISAGSIAMGLGGYLAARSDAEHYASERETEQRDSDRADRRACGRRGLWPGQSNFVARYLCVYSGRMTRIGERQT
jgi:hypothetical protein